jgi:hypothetical protein
LVTEVNQLRKECHEMREVNVEIEKGMEYINKNQEDTNMKVKVLEREKKLIAMP